MIDQEPISLEALCDLLDCAAKAADLVTGAGSDWRLRDSALPLLRILVEEEVAQNGQTILSESLRRVHLTLREGHIGKDRL